MTNTEPVAGIPRTVAVINGKGGSFKTSVVSSLGGLLAAADEPWRVLLVDLDPQGNLDEDLGLGETSDNGQHQLDVIPNGRPFAPTPTGRPGLDIVHGGELLDDLQAMMVSRQMRDPNGWLYALARSLDSVADDYDLILIDCPPGSEILQTMALVAARHALIPARSDASSRKGLLRVASRFISVRPFNNDLELLGVVRTGMTTSGKKMREAARQRIEADLGGAAPVFNTVIRYAESPAVAVRETGRLPHEMEPDLAPQQERLFQRLRDRKRTRDLGKAGKHRSNKPGETLDTEEAEITLAPSTAGLAQDYVELAQEFVDLLVAAEAKAEVASA